MTSKYAIWCALYIFCLQGSGTPLLGAADSGKLEMVRLLLDKYHCDVNASIANVSVGAPFCFLCNVIKFMYFITHNPVEMDPCPVCRIQWSL